jgi:hypothetical protein
LHCHPVAPRGSQYRFTHRDGITRSTIACANNGWADLQVVDTADSKPVVFKRDGRTDEIWLSWCDQKRTGSVRSKAE